MWGDAPAVQLPPSGVDPADARQQARRILGEGGYRPQGRSLADRALGWIGDLFEDLSLPGAPGGGPSWLGAALVVTLVVVLAWLGWRFLRGIGWPVGRPRPPQVVVDVEPAGVAPESRRALLAAAEAAEGDGRWADAVRYRFRALVLGLAQRRLLPADPAATTGELRRALPADDEVRTGFAQAAERFELVRYGGEPGSAEDAGRIAEWDRRLVGDGRR